MNRHMTELRRCLANDLRGFYFVEDADLEGFKLCPTGSDYAAYTIYCSPDGTYSAYIAIPNILKGIDVEDERPLIERTGLFSAVSRIKAHHITVSPESYMGLVSPWERKDFWAGGIFNR